MSPAKKKTNRLLEMTGYNWFIHDFKKRYEYFIGIGKDLIFYGWIPLIVMIGMLPYFLMHLGYFKCENKPSLIRMINPLS